MWRNDPFRLWRTDAELKRSFSPQERDRFDAASRAAIDRLEQFLDHPPPRANFWNVHFGGVPESFGLPKDQVFRAQDLYRRIVAVGGAGNHYAQETLLGLVAATHDPASIPFWLEIVNLARPRESFATQRRTYAVAALARLAIGNVPEAVAALRQLACHPRVDIRALAIYYLGRAFLEAERPVPPDLLAQISEIARNDPDSQPRFQARVILQENQMPVPLDNPGGVYTFKVKYKWAKGITRTIELKSEEMLDDLHIAIQQALKWDDDHLYAFFMNGVKWDDRYSFVSPDDDNGPRWTTEIAIGELGLTPNYKFLYYFDYGDSHEFEIQVVAIDPRADRGEYPRVVESEGEIEQYPSWDESEEE